MDEVELWQKFNDKDEEAFEIIYNKYYREMLSFGRQLLNNTQEIEDCIQDVFIKLRNKRGTLPLLKSSLRAYLFQVFKHYVFDFKAAKRYRFIEDQTDKERLFEITLPLEHYLIEEEEKGARKLKLNKYLQSLSARQREVVYYKIYKT